MEGGCALCRLGVGRKNKEMGEQLETCPKCSTKSAVYAALEMQPPPPPPMGRFSLALSLWASLHQPLRYFVGFVRVCVLSARQRYVVPRALCTRSSGSLSLCTFTLCIFSYHTHTHRDDDRANHQTFSPNGQTRFPVRHLKRQLIFLFPSSQSNTHKSFSEYFA